ncbi:hypothetical protein J31TS6_36730 [Brevibacillus reuszeri]|uniref:MauE/DoxX family redox-associated membrane protein n=1 Tax=Brevibacillus reuszeri TaxID=54915 RepID=UPI001B0E8EC2|nr:MauE/DoxX family redox-associated membrane protein [Brevibacillus reuszeri]GIO07645.1 hypothetical protein J31TS6_36730 [Brevibacillus reuszeri]
MDELGLFIRIGLSTLFLSTGLSKWNKIHHHQLTVEQYQILPKRLVPFFARAEVWVEILVGIGLLVGITYAAMGAGVLLLMYSIAITINLLRGRNHISCGCGGLAGDHALSWWLVTRNLFLFCGAVYAALYGAALFSVETFFANQTVDKAFSTNAIWKVFSSYAILLVLIFANEIVQLRKQIKNLLHTD